LRSPAASVVIPTFQAGPGFDDLLRRLFSQKTNFGYEVLVIDSGSTDGTAELARRHGASVHRIAPNEFDHGATRNLGASLSAGRYVAFLVQDALPTDDDWLATMVENLDADETVAGVYGRQIPHPESSPLTRVLMRDWPTSSLERREQFAATYAALPPATRRSLAVFDNVSSCVRRPVWEQIPFERTRFGEDLRWGKAVVEAGHKLVYEPRSAVLHSHERGALYDLKRHYVDALVLQELFGLTPTPNLPRLLLNVVLTCAHLYRSNDDKNTLIAPKFLLLAVRYALCSQAGAYLAARRHRKSRIDSRIAARFHEFMLKGI
jgi:glycosyltransferase involved in cell wall biosynthesis